jgi:hypothetical protein
VQTCYTIPLKHQYARTGVHVTSQKSCDRDYTWIQVGNWIHWTLFTNVYNTLQVFTMVHSVRSLLFGPSVLHRHGLAASLKGFLASLEAPCIYCPVAAQQDNTELNSTSTVLAVSVAVCFNTMLPNNGYFHDSEY